MRLRDGFDFGRQGFNNIIEIFGIAVFLSPFYQMK